jgi:hypothetical protein
MKVKLLRTWFYPVDAKPVNDKRAISGGRYKKGTHDDIPEELRPYLPKDAVVLDDDKPVVVPKEDLGIVPPQLSDFDGERLDADAEAKLLEGAEEARQAAIKVKRVAALAKAREAKKAKKDAK